MSEPWVILTCGQAAELRQLLSIVEDWLLHCSDEIHDDLAAFLADLGWARPRHVTHLIADLGYLGVALGAHRSEREHP